MTNTPSLWSKITFPNKRKKTASGLWQVEAEFEFGANGGRIAVGVDPGVNFGVTIIYGHRVSVLNGKLPRRTEKGWYGVEAYNLIQDICNAYDVGSDIAVVEGASYRSQFGQVGLEEVRFGFFFGLYKIGANVHIVPPATVRLRAFGSGKQQAGEIWPWLNHNGADSIGMALAALEMNDD